MNWRKVKNNIEDKEFDEFEKEFKVSIPKDYKEIVEKYNGGIPEKKFLKINDNEYVFYSLLSLNKSDKYNVYKAYSWIHDRLNDGYVPIAEDSFGNYYCYDTNSDMKIYLWNHESNKLTFISNNITELIEMLE